MYLVFGALLAYYTIYSSTRPRIRAITTSAFSVRHFGKSLVDSSTACSSLTLTSQLDGGWNIEWESGEIGMYCAEVLNVLDLGVGVLNVLDLVGGASNVLSLVIAWKASGAGVIRTGFRNDIAVDRMR
jgi:hypothetical protein